MNLDNAIIVQKLFFFSMWGMMLTGTFFDLAGPDSELQMFFLTMVGGTVGAGVNYCLYDVTTLKQLARQALANLGLAVLFGPTVTFMVVKWAGVPLSVYVVVAVSGTIGIGGTAIWKVMAPVVLNAIPDVILQYVLRVGGSRFKREMPVEPAGVQPESKEAGQ